MDYDKLGKIAYQCLIDLSHEEGINASGKDDVYGCIFGRDSFLTILKILNYYEKHRDEILIDICKRSIRTLVNLQGKNTNLESGEEPGKFIHEFRKDKYERLLTLEKPWYVYPDGYLRNYDSIDSTPLALITIYRFWKITNDSVFLKEVIPAVEKGLRWMLQHGDKDRDKLLEYELHADRKYGGLAVQSWTDSIESISNPQKILPKYPIAPVEVQGYAWLAFKYWADFYRKYSNGTEINTLSYRIFADTLTARANKIKDVFNRMYLIEDSGLHFTATALDGDKNKISYITGNTLILLWATYMNGDTKETVLDTKYIGEIVERGFKDDLFDPDGGVRTMSTLSETYDSSQNSYHNGSFWPVLNGLIHEGLMNWGFENEAKRLKEASLKAIEYFQTPIELYTKSEDGRYLPYLNPMGQMSCLQQAWSAAATLDLVYA